MVFCSAKEQPVPGLQQSFTWAGCSVLYTTLAIPSQLRCWRQTHLWSNTSSLLTSLSRCKTQLWLNISSGLQQSQLLQGTDVFPSQKVPTSITTLKCSTAAELGSSSGPV